MMKYFADVEVFVVSLYLQICTKANSHVRQNVCRIRYLCSGLKISNQIFRSRNKIIFAATPTFFFFVTIFFEVERYVPLHANYFPVRVSLHRQWQFRYSPI